MSTVIERPLTQLQLKTAILDFTQGRDTGYLGTYGPSGVHVSPVKFFLDDDLNVYIHSRGGTKFENLATHSQACLLVSSPFQDDFNEIKGVQLFGKTQVAHSNSQLYETAEELCPWEHPADTKLIYMNTTEAVFVDRLAGADIKQKWYRK